MAVPRSPWVAAAAMASGVGVIGYPGRGYGKTEWVASRPVALGRSLISLLLCWSDWEQWPFRGRE